MHESRPVAPEPTLRWMRRSLMTGILTACMLTAVRAQSPDPLSEADEPVDRSPVATNSMIPLELDQVGAGELLWKTDRGWYPLPIAGIDVEIEVTGVMIRGRVLQRFHNPTSEVIEAVYVFPLPEHAAVSHMEMRIGERRVVSRVQEKEEARRTYARAKAEGRKSALVDQRRPNLFTTAVANLNPGESISVVLEYFEESHYDAGRFSLRFPLTYTPRYVPPASALGDDEAERDGEDRRHDEPPPEVAAPFLRTSSPSVPLAGVTVRLKPGFSLRTLESRSHEVEVSESAGLHRVSTVPARIPADRDFLLSWAPSLEERPQAAVFLEDRPDTRYALILMVPPAEESDLGLGLPTETLFVVDVSGSMKGPSIRQAREALLAALDRMRPEDRFNIVKFNDHSEPFRAEFQQAETEPLESARAWVRNLKAGGGTMIHPALTLGLEMMGRSRSSHAQRIVFLTDGAVSNERELLDSVVARLGKIRLHTIGIGHAPNAYLMRKMAELGGGLCEFVADTGETRNRVDAFFDRLNRPVLSDVRLDVEGIELDEMHPRRLADLHAGQPLLLSARVTGGTERGTLSLGGYSRDGWTRTPVRITEDSPRGPGIAVRWARARVESLMDSLHEGADARAVRSEVVELGLEFHLVTAYTSLVAVDESVTAEGASKRLRLGSVLPAGGTDRPLRLLAGWALIGLGGGLLAWKVLGKPR